MKYSHLFFDLDGTLWDLQRNTRQALAMLFELPRHAALAQVSFEEFVQSYLRHNEHVWGLYREGLMDKETLRVVRFQRAFADMGLRAVKEQIHSFANEFMQLCPHQPHLVNGALQLLNQLHGKVQLHIITNGFIEVQGHKLKAGGITHYFTHIINSEQCNARKPSKAIFEYAMQLAGAHPAECLMIGDDWEADIVGAHRVGIDQAWLCTEDSPLRTFQPTYRIHSLEKLTEVIGFKRISPTQ